MTIDEVSTIISDALEDYKLITWDNKPTAKMIVSSFLKEYRKSLQKTIEDGVDF